jgi:hypothetical protein
MYKGKKTGSKSGVFARYNEKDYITEERSRKQSTNWHERERRTSEIPLSRSTYTSRAFLVVLKVGQTDLLESDIVSFSVFPRLARTCNEFGVSIDAIC